MYSLCHALKESKQEAHPDPPPRKKGAAPPVLRTMNQLHLWDEWYEFARETLRFAHADASSYAHRQYTAELRSWRISLRVDALDGRLAAA